jgi:hypothetical protein
MPAASRLGPAWYEWQDVRFQGRERTDCPLSSAITAWKRGYLAYGTPPPC